MAGPFRWYPNRKSGIGLRACSKVPRAHRVPTWSTTPPIATEVLVEPETMSKIRHVLRGMVLVMTAAENETGTGLDMQAMDDARLAALAFEALTHFKRVKVAFDQVDVQLKDLRKEADRMRKDHAIEERAVVEAQKAIKERDDIAAKYKELQKQIDPEKQQLEIMYAIDEATKATRDEVATLRRDLAQRQSEIDNLRASKKRLRDALDRLAGKD